MALPPRTSHRGQDFLPETECLSRKVFCHAVPVYYAIRPRAEMTKPLQHLVTVDEPGRAPPGWTRRTSGSARCGRDRRGRARPRRSSRGRWRALPPGLAQRGDFRPDSRMPPVERSTAPYPGAGAKPRARPSAELVSLPLSRMEYGWPPGWDDCAFTVLARVVTKPAADRIIVDSGSKTSDERPGAGLRAGTGIRSCPALDWRRPESGRKSPRSSGCRKSTPTSA